MADDEHRLLRLLENGAKSERVTAHDRQTTLAAPRCLGTRGRRARPRAVVIEQLPFEAPVAGIVQLAQNPAPHPSPVEREVGGSLCARELARHAELDPLARELVAQPARLLLARPRQRARD